MNEIPEWAVNLVRRTRVITRRYSGNPRYKIRVLGDIDEEMTMNYNMVKQAMKRRRLWNLENKLWLTLLFNLDFYYEDIKDFPRENKRLSYMIFFYPKLPLLDNNIVHLYVPGLIGNDLQGTINRLLVIGGDPWIDNIDGSESEDTYIPLDGRVFAFWRRVKSSMYLACQQFPVLLQELRMEDRVIGSLYDGDKHSIDYKQAKYLRMFMESNFNNLPNEPSFLKDLYISHRDLELDTEIARLMKSQINIIENLFTGIPLEDLERRDVELMRQHPTISEMLSNTNTDNRNIDGMDDKDQ